MPRTRKGTLLDAAGLLTCLELFCCLCTVVTLQKLALWSTSRRQQVHSIPRWPLLVASALNWKKQLEERFLTLHRHLVVCMSWTSRQWKLWQRGAVHILVSHRSESDEETRGCVPPSSDLLLPANLYLLNVLQPLKMVPRALEQAFETWAWGDILDAWHNK